MQKINLDTDDETDFRARDFRIIRVLDSSRRTYLLTHSMVQDIV